MAKTNEGKSALLIRIEILEEEVASIKAKLMLEDSRPPVRLQGLGKDIEVTEEDIEEAKRSLFPKLDDI